MSFIKPNVKVLAKEECVGLCVGLAFLIDLQTITLDGIYFQLTYTPHIIWISKGIDSAEET